ncbi:hypothetical protein GC163_11445 [bacterium]|nr:hypothetical protein [bacterium]
MKRLSCLCSLLWLVVLGFAPVSAQDSPNLIAEVKSVETKGKTTILTVVDTASSTEYQFQLTPKVEVEIVANGDDTFLAEGVLIRTQATESNKSLFATNIDAYPQYSGKPVPAKAVKAPPKPGQSQNSYIVSGEVVELEAPADEKYKVLQLKVNAKSKMPVYLEPNHKIRVVLTDAASIKEGQQAEITGRVAGTKLIPSKVVIQTGEDLVGSEFLPTLPKR